jgi:hypothetical protein
MLSAFPANSLLQHKNSLFDGKNPSAISLQSVNKLRSFNYLGAIPRIFSLLAGKIVTDMAPA